MTRGDKVKRAVLAAAAAAILGTGASFPAMAQGEIPEARISIRSQYEGGTVKQPQIQLLGEGSQLESVSWDKGEESWKPGEERTGIIVLKASSGRRFGSGAESTDVNVTGGQCVLAQESDKGERLELTVRYTPEMKLGKTGKAAWDSANYGTAVWEPVPMADSYQLCLYEKQGTCINTMTLSGTSADLSSYLEEGEYYYTVKAVPPSENRCLLSGEQAYSDPLCIPGTAKRGWKRIRGRLQYTDETGAKAADGWRHLDGDWYYFDREGNAQTGWQCIGGRWYFLNEDGRMKCGWLNESGTWYYLDPTGAMVTGWHALGPANLYYFKQDGSMAFDTVVDGRRLSRSGRAETN